MTRAGCRAALSRSGFETLAMTRDWQQPSVRKLLRHARLDRVLGRLASVNARLPRALPIPGVRLVHARAAR
jgi:hypothetical protein